MTAGSTPRYAVCMQESHIANAVAEYAFRPDASEIVAVVIGAGPTGLRAARTLAAHGIHVSVFERDPIAVRAASEDLRALLRRPNARVVGRVDVVAILGSPHTGEVRGVRARLRGLHDAEFFADLVIDSTRNGSPFNCWRGCPGFARPDDVDALLERTGALAAAG